MAVDVDVDVEEVVVDNHRDWSFETMDDAGSRAGLEAAHNAPFDKNGGAVLLGRCRSLTNCCVYTHFGHGIAGRAAFLGIPVARLGGKPL